MSEIDIEDYIRTDRNSFSFRIIDFIDDLIRERLELIIPCEDGDEMDDND